MSERDLSVVVFGASGITGRQVCAYLSERCEQLPEARWAAAGRDPERVRKVLSEVGASAPEVLRADLSDPASLASMASRARVVLDLVGPYTLYGEPVIEACIAGGAHYMDLTGEVPFVRRMIESAGERAAAAGVKIVNTAGFESLPPDLLTLLATQAARERWSEDLATVDLDAHLPTDTRGAKLADMVSGGTLQSMAEILADERAGLAADPAALIVEEGEAQKVRAVSPISIAPRFTAEGEVVVPMIPSPLINPAVVQRSAALLAAEEGRAFAPFRYREGVAIPGSPATVPLRYAGAAAVSGVQALSKALVTARPSIRTRAASVMRKRFPSSGFGPQGERLEDWKWGMTVQAKTVGGHHVRVDLDGDGQPGYLTTARMLGEAGLILAEEGAAPERSGFITPALAVGAEHVERFRHAGARIQVSS